jgi:hypothetical protein
MVDDRRWTTDDGLNEGKRPFPHSITLQNKTAVSATKNGIENDADRGG